MTIESTKPGTAKRRECQSCFGSGETVSEMGPADCPDCGGTGTLPSRATLTDWRSRDIEGRYANRDGQEGRDLRWLLSELRRARASLTQIVALAMDGKEDDPIVQQIRGAAYDALGLYDTVQADSKRNAGVAEPH